MRQQKRACEQKPHIDSDEIPSDFRRISYCVTDTVLYNHTESNNTRGPLKLEFASDCQFKATPFVIHINWHSEVLKSHSSPTVTDCVLGVLDDIKLLYLPKDYV